ncbi:helix-turn-helix transcriptional regulator [Bacillus sp. DX4.1]|uniref:helix-turn-helix transcriptional regulator n=1 Tax=Bacillus sp. DX4.1 TaxID=3055867 RepID=UPI0025A0D3B7|nr:helix-turn-helix transcriptional regulator [Bacillus sp. DX4.1]MDM5186789.1 helix-turn-helix transcriptional regulator [Bacillus sp. DX4.1]
MALFKQKKISNIAKNLKDYRLQEGMTQKDFVSLLEMNPQNYSKLERGVYTPSLEKLLEICDILHLTPNDLLMDGREYEEFKAEVFDSFDDSIIDLVGTIKTVKEQRAKAIFAKNRGNEKEERIHLDFIIGMFAWKNEHYWGIADYLYRKHIKKDLDNVSKKISNRLVEKMEEDYFNE